MACSRKAVYRSFLVTFQRQAAIGTTLPGAAAVGVLQLGTATVSLPANGLPPFLIISSQMVQKSATAYRQWQETQQEKGEF